MSADINRGAGGDAGRQGVAIDVDVEHEFEVRRFEDQPPVETLGADGADEAPGDSVRLRRSHRRLHDPGAVAAQDPRRMGRCTCCRGRGSASGGDGADVRLSSQLAEVLIELREKLPKLRPRGRLRGVGRLPQLLMHLPRQARGFVS